MNSSPNAAFRSRAAVTNVLMAVVGVFAPAQAALAQREPPPPLQVEGAALPEFELRTLSSGAELIVIADHEQPFVTVNLVFRGGTSADPERQAGVAAMTAELLTAGIQDQPAEQVAADLDALGVSLGATAGPDYVTVSLGAVTDQLDAAVAILADVVRRPQLPADRLAGLVAQAQNALSLQTGSTTYLASRAFTRELYGAHPYGKVETFETLARIDVQAVTRFHRSFFVPNNAVFVVAGDISADDASRLLDRFFQDWQPGQVSLPTYFGLPERSEREVVLVHVPGSPETVVRAGQTTAKGDDDDWTALRVANRILGEGRGSRLHLAAEGQTSALPSTALIQRRDVGTFQARWEGPADDAVVGLERVLQEMERLASTPPEPAELEAVQRYLTGSLPLSVETPQQMADQVTSYLLLGIDRQALETYPGRIAALTPDQVTEAASTHLDSDGLMIVVAGDARRLHAPLSGLGAVRIVDSEGEALELAALSPPRAGAGYDASGLVPMTWDYDVLAKDFPAGEVRRRLVADPERGTLRIESVGVIGPRAVRRQVTFRAADFVPVEAIDRLQIQGRTLTSSLTLNGLSIQGLAKGPGGEQNIEGESVPGAVMGEMSEAVLWLLDLDELDELEIPVIGQDARVGNVTLRMKGETQIRVPAGLFNTYEIELEGGGQRQVIYVRKEHPRFTVKIELVGQPVETVLTRVVEGSPDH